MRFLPMLVMLLPLCALPQEAPKEGGRGHHGPPKNLKILKPEQLRPAMESFRAALGVQCTFCHVRGDFASDENPHKNTARMMLTMVQEINAKFPGNANARTYVTCYTCHRGQKEPATAPPTAAAAPGE